MEVRPDSKNLLGEAHQLFANVVRLFYAAIWEQYGAK
jgi:hypothetical protein